MRFALTTGGIIKITATEREWHEGYSVGRWCPFFTTGNTLTRPPESDGHNPYPKNSESYWRWRIGFNSAVM